jgi:flavin-dependent dehydrogenase
VDKACGEGLMPDGLERLRAMGVELLQGEGMPFRGIRYLEHGLVAEGEFPGVVGWGIRRPTLHAAMVRRAEQLGVDLRWSTAATGLEASGVRTGSGLIEGRWIVGADGLHSRVRRWAGLDGSPSPRKRFGVRRHYAMEPWTDLVEVYWGPGCEAYVTPVGPRTVGVAILVSGRPARYGPLLPLFPELEARVASAPIESEDRGAGPLEHRARRMVQGNVALVGDASVFLDAISGEGLSLAFHEAAALVSTLPAGAPENYEVEHRRINRLPGAMTRLLLLLERRTGLRRRVLQALAADPALFSKLLALHVRALPPSRLGLGGVLGLAARLAFPPRQRIGARASTEP